MANDLFSSLVGVSAGGTDVVGVSAGGTVVVGVLQAGDGFRSVANFASAEVVEVPFVALDGTSCLLQTQRNHGAE